MSEFMDILKNRRSIRKYLDEPVTAEQLQMVLEAVQWSPSWANTQCWEIVVVTDTSVKTALQDTIAPKNPATKAIVAAPVLLALCARRNSSGYYNGAVTTKFGDWFLFDLGIATQSICLAAQSLGLGTVIVGLFDHDKAARVLQAPADHEVVALIPLGHPAKTGSAPARRAVSEFRHDNTL